MNKTLTINYQEVSLEALTAADRQLVESAIAATHTAYSPYSHFSVGAALRLANGEVVMGSNQENAAYPSGLCAERTAMFSAAAQHPEEAFDSLAIVGRNAEGVLTPASPCGSCRQVMAEYEHRGQRNLRVLVYFSKDKILIFEEVKSLLPFIFTL